VVALNHPIPEVAVLEVAVLEAQFGSFMVDGDLAMNLADDEISQSEIIALKKLVGRNSTQATVSLGCGVVIPGKFSSGKYAYNISASREAAVIAANDEADNEQVPNQISIFGVEGAGRSFVEGTHPCLYTGHVGYSFDFGKSIFSFSPYAPNESMSSVIYNLKSPFHKVYSGEVIRDEHFFKLASESTATTRSGNPQIVYKLDIPVTRLKYASAMNHNFSRGFQTELPEFAYAFQTGVNCSAPFNCATYPASLGLPIPLDSGQIKNYISSMIQQGATQWKPFN
jgi:hypothetical protein